VTTDEDPQARVSLLPQFKRPPSPPPPEASPPEAPLSPGPTAGPAGAPHPTSRPMWHGRPPSPEDGPAKTEHTRTETSSAGDDGGPDKPSKGEVIALCIGLLGVVTVGASALVRWRTGRRLRQPTPGQARDIAAPLGRIAYRLAEFSWLGPNVIDGIKAVTATGAYINDGPLLLHGDIIDPGVPADLQEDDQ
jgi:hypothetical protein